MANAITVKAAQIFGQKLPSAITRQGAQLSLVVPHAPPIALTNASSTNNVKFNAPERA